MGRAKGPSKTTIKLKPARYIDEALINNGRLSYYRSKFLKEHGIKPADGSRDTNFLLFLEMQTGTEGKTPGITDSELESGRENKEGRRRELPAMPVAVRRASFLKDQFAVVLQTDWQRDLFLRGDATAHESDRAGCAGILTDVTYKVFDNFYLCTSSIFSYVLGRWVPVLWSVLLQQKEADFADHFFHLFSLLQQNGVASSDIERLMSGTVDFSRAQRNGFIAAYTRWRSDNAAFNSLSEQAQAAERKLYATHAATLLKGCLFHFRQSVTRVKRNGNFVAADKQTTFEHHIDGLLTATRVHELTDHAAQLLSLFPDCHDWLVWWLACDVAAMLFPALKLMTPAKWDSLPSSISALESLHSFYYLCLTTNMDLLSGCQCLQELAELLEAEHSAQGQGKATRYGRSKIRPIRLQRKKRGGKFFNDGRAPDSDVLQSKGKSSATKRKPKADKTTLVSPKVSQEVHLTST